MLKNVTKRPLKRWNYIFVKFFSAATTNHQRVHFKQGEKKTAGMPVGKKLFFFTENKRESSKKYDFA